MNCDQEKRAQIPSYFSNHNNFHKQKIICGKEYFWAVFGSLGTNFFLVHSLDLDYRLALYAILQIFSDLHALGSMSRGYIVEAGDIDPKISSFESKVFCMDKAIQV